MAQSTDADANGTQHEAPLPTIAAAFLVTFDNRKGYTLAWQKTLDDVKLDGVVEFKSLPSGLHNVNEDLVYFVHGDYAGISAFLERDDETAARNARMLAVGVLIPIEGGRTGKSWLYAQELKALASTLLDDPSKQTPLDEFWEKHKHTEAPALDSPIDSPALEGYQKLRALSTGTLSIPNRTLPLHHPALALPDLLSTFGPLIFPLFRAALLHKRILVLGEAPVEQTCNHVYNISILSSISNAVGAHVPSYEPSSSRLRPLFNVGISDISTLEAMKSSWIACTTDDVLCSKPNLFDVLVILPATNALQKSGNKRYPKLIMSTPELSKTFPRRGLLASQRDSRRYSALKRILHTLPPGTSLGTTSLHSGDEDGRSETSTLSTVPEKREAVEPLPWTVIAYNSLIWWASAGDRRSGLLEAEELANEQDEEMTKDCLAEDVTTKEVAMVAYFHKLSTLIFSVLNNAVRRHGHDRYHDDEEEENEHNEDQALLSPNKGDDEDVVEITEEDVRAMGLDVWSEPDKRFISELLDLWWKRKAVVSGGVIECCGIRVL